MHSNIFIFVFILNLYGSDICQYIYIYIEAVEVVVI